METTIDWPLLGESLIQISEIIIWPLTIILILKMFKPQIEKKLEDVEHFKASSDGVEASFRGKVKEMSEENRLPQPPQSRSIGSKEANLKPELINSKLPPYEQLFMINSKLEEYLKSIAKNNHISIDDFESIAMIRTLLYEKLIDVDKARKLENIVNLVRSARPNISKDQINIVRKYYENI